MGDRKIEVLSRVAVVVLACHFIESNLDKWVLIIDQEFFIFNSLLSDYDLWWEVLNYLLILVSEPIFSHILLEGWILLSSLQSFNFFFLELTLVSLFKQFKVLNTLEDRGILFFHIYIAALLDVALLVLKV